ncbi:MAG: amidophosphoribosyltransferase [Thermomicrobiales bacterium]|jgi:amidophosphoribosyltransferase|nr:amidophosphoribosyltransferase [Thermomicrobiales bacterium]
MDSDVFSLDFQADDKPHEECGVFGIYAPGEDVARITFFGLYALQHRGQESAGIATSNGQRLFRRTHLGLVSQAFNEADLSALPGIAAIGHTRYSTTGQSNERNAGPMLTVGPQGPVAVAHNGNIVNAYAIKENLEAGGETFETSTDSEVLTRLIALSPGSTMIEKIRVAMPALVGAYSLAVLTPEAIYAVRDPKGVRPLCIGRLGDHWIVASESCALTTVGAQFIREIEPGEIIQIDMDGLHSFPPAQSDRHATCLFELIYFSRPDSVILNQRLYLVRKRMGEVLAREHPVDADVVVGLPDSATPAAIGFAQASGIPYSEGLIKNRYIGRTFIQPDQRLREVGVSLKFNALPEVLENKRVVLVDDTIVRGTTSRPIVQLLRNAGAREVHMRVHAPPMMYPCYLGVDLARREELIAARMTVEEIGQHIGVDSIGYLSLDGLLDAINAPGAGFCTGCLTGNYPVPVQLEMDMHKLVLEREPVAT